MCFINPCSRTGPYRAALEERTRDRVPLDWAMTQNNLGTALETLGERDGAAGGSCDGESRGTGRTDAGTDTPPSQPLLYQGSALPLSYGSSLCRPVEQRSASPAARNPYPSATMPDPGAWHPHSAGIARRHVRSGHPDILDAVPCPITWLPDITGGWWGWDRFGYRRGWGDPDHYADPGNARDGHKRQCRGA